MCNLRRLRDEPPEKLIGGRHAFLGINQMTVRRFAGPELMHIGADGFIFRSDSSVDE